MHTPTNAFDFSSGHDDVHAFIDDHQSAVMVKVVDREHGDPVELTPDEARALAAALLDLAARLDDGPLA